MVGWAENQLQDKWLEHRGLSYRNLLIKPVLKVFLLDIYEKKKNVVILHLQELNLFLAQHV